MESKLDQTQFEVGQETTCRFFKKIFTIIYSISHLSLSHSKTVFNTNLIFPCCVAAVSMVQHKLVPYFVPGEEEPVAMTTQLVKMGQKVDKCKIYKADGIVLLQGWGHLEVLLVETAGPYTPKGLVTKNATLEALALPTVTIVRHCININC